MHTADVVNTIERQGLSAHKYANIQVYRRRRPNDSTSLCRDLGGCIEHVASWMDTNRLQRKDGIHMVRSISSAPSVSVISTSSWLCSGDTSRLSTRLRRLPGQQHVNEVALYKARVHVLRHPSTDS